MSEQTLAKFKEIYQIHFGRVPEDVEAIELAGRLINLYRAISKAKW